MDSADRGINGAALQVTVNDALVQTLVTNTTGNAIFTLTATQAIDYIINAAWDGVATYAMIFDAAGDAQRLAGQLHYRDL